MADDKQPSNFAYNVWILVSNSEGLAKQFRPANPDPALVTVNDITGKLIDEYKNSIVAKTDYKGNGAFANLSYEDRAAVDLYIADNRKDVTAVKLDTLRDECASNMDLKVKAGVEYGDRIQLMYKTEYQKTNRDKSPLPESVKTQVDNLEYRKGTEVKSGHELPRTYPLVNAKTGSIEI